MYGFIIMYRTTILDCLYTGTSNDKNMYYIKKNKKIFMKQKCTLNTMFWQQFRQRSEFCVINIVFEVISFGK